MKHVPALTPAPCAPVWRTVQTARRNLTVAVDEFVAAAAQRDATDEPASVLALRVTPGTGKTGTTLGALARHAADLLKRGHVLFYVPTLDLAERAAEAFQALAPDIPCAVVRGRQALDPDGAGERMCSRHELAEKIASLVPSVTEALCRARRKDGTVCQAPCASGCPYLAQKDVKGAKVFFLSHAYLGAHPPVDRDMPVALRVIDEKVYPTLARTSWISLEDYMRAPAAAFPVPLRPALAEAKSAIVEGLQRKVPLPRHLRDAGITATDLATLAHAEARSREELDIRPWHAEASIRCKVSRFDAANLRASLTRGEIFATLAKTATDTCNRVSFHEVPIRGEARQIIKVHALTPLPRDAPVLLLDADAHPAIVEALAPGATFGAVDVKPSAEVIQVEDRTLSNTWLLDPAKGPRRRRKILDLVAREVERAEGRGVLVVASTAVLAKLHHDAGQSVDADEGSLLKPLLGAQPRWFGPRMHGVNDFEDFATIVVIGRLQPPPVAIEDATRCIFGDDAAPLAEHGVGPLVASATPRLMDGNEFVDATFRSHPDPRALVMLRQMRECQSLQAIARLRLVAPRHPKRVVILSNLPLPDFPVSRLIPFQALCRGLEAEPDPSGFLRLEAALCATMGQIVRGARLSAAGLASDLPRDFNSESAAREFRRGRTTPALIALAQRIASANGWPLTVLALKRPGGGKPTAALVFCEPGQALSVARRLWPALTPSHAAPPEVLPVK